MKILRLWVFLSNDIEQKFMWIAVWYAELKRTQKHQIRWFWVAFLASSKSENV